MGRVIALLTALAVGAGPMSAQQSRVFQEGSTWVEELAGSLPARPVLAIKLDAGNVNVQGGGEQTIRYVLKKRVRASSETEARRQLGRFHFTARQSGDRAVLEGGTASAWRIVSGELVVHVPRSIGAVKAITDGGNESVSGITGRADVVTGGGSVHLDDIGGGVSALSSGGEITVGKILGDLVLRTGGGNVSVSSATGNIHASTAGGSIVIQFAGQAVLAETAGGNIAVRKCGGPVTARTGGGNVDLGQIGAGAVLQSAGGSLRLASAKGAVMAGTAGGTIELFGLSGGANVQTGGGEIVAEFAGGDFQGSSLQTPRGDVTVYLAPSLKATVHAQVELTGGYHLRSDFPEIVVSNGGGAYGPQNLRADGNLNGGGAPLSVRTFSGNIEFKRARK